MKLLRILSIALALMMGTAIHAEEKTVNGQPYVLLNNGIWMPRFGIGTYNVPGDSTACDAVSYALKCGYRHIDTAHAYRVERGVGKTMEAIDKMLQRLQTDHIDLLYVHHPLAHPRGLLCDSGGNPTRLYQGERQRVRFPTFRRGNGEDACAQQGEAFLQHGL